MRIAVFIFITIFSAASAHADGLEKFLADVDAAVAPLKQTIGEPVRVTFAKLDRSTAIDVDCTKNTETHILGTIKTNPFTGNPKHPLTILLNENFLPIIEAGELAAKTFPCGHGNLYKLALATAVHEYAHLYDYSDAHLTKSDRIEIENCEFKERDGDHSVYCRDLLAMRGKVSERRRYKNFAGFAEHTDLYKNTNFIRSVDPYEATNPREHFAVNMEYFLLDPNYACRKPAHYQYFAELTGAHPFADVQCPAFTTVLTSASGLPVNLDPKRAYEVDYLFAGKGDQLMSRWGHAMLRIVMCAPERKEVGPDCLNDVAYHVVLGFRAYEDAAITSYWKGLTGKYPSQLLVASLGEIVDEYNRGELRDLTSLPLKLTRSEMELLINRSREEYWSYAGKYYFLSNNCASEADELIKGVLPEYHSYQDQAIVSPLGIYDDLEFVKLTDPAVLQDETTAVKNGYFFPSQRRYLEKAFVLAGVQGTLDDYLEKSSASERREIFKNSNGDVRSAAAFYALEKAIQRRMEGKLSQAVTKLIVEANENGKELPGVPKDVLGEVTAVRNSLLPWNLTAKRDGYGIPLADELIGGEEYKARIGKLAELGRALQAVGQAQFALVRKEIDATKENLKLIVAKMR